MSESCCFPSSRRTIAWMVRALCEGFGCAHLLLLEEGDLAELHAERGVVLQQLLCAGVGVARRHNRQRQLRAAPRLGLQRQDRLYVHLYTTAERQSPTVDTGDSALFRLRLGLPVVTRATCFAQIISVPLLLTVARTSGGMVTTYWGQIDRVVS